MSFFSTATKVGTPYVVSKKKGGSIENGGVVHLASDTAAAQIYFTTDGSLPELHKIGIKVKQFSIKTFTRDVSVFKSFVSILASVCFIKFVEHVLHSY